MSDRHLLGQIRDFLDNRGSYFSEFASLDGSGVTFSAIGASSATESYIIEAAGQGLDLARMIVTIEDAAVAADDYGGIASGLDNGIEVRHEDSSGNVLENITMPAVPVVKNVDWAAYCYDGEPRTFGAGNNYFQARWTFTKAGLPLRMAAGDIIRIIIRDGLTGLVDHKFLFQGRQK
jgi:hypothetical protein